MKLLIFAHVPPPHHGQSYMVQLMLDGLGGDRRKHHPPGVHSPHQIECYHVNVRLSKRLQDIGDFRLWKLLLLLGHCLEAIWCRFRYGVMNFYYIPAPGKRSALYRDWVVMLICRPFFKRVILHWHAAGLAKWLETVVLMRSRSLTYDLMKNVDLSIVLSEYNRPDAEKLLPKQIKVVGNGIPDPCPAFEREVLPRRKARMDARAKVIAGGKSFAPPDPAQTEGDPRIFKLLYMAHCTREKGLFDTIEGVVLANARLAQAGSPIRVCLTVGGEFFNLAERTEFTRRIASPDLQIAGPLQATVKSCVTYAGFISGERKNQALIENDCFCFPTYYYAENFSVVILEAMAFGLPIITTRWRSIPELLAPDYPGFVQPRSPDQIASAIFHMLCFESAQPLREQFLRRFTLDQYLKNLAQAIHSVEQPPEPASAVPLPQPL
jgi:glycosyltransferase involved in cell wall biosynthesis